MRRRIHRPVDRATLIARLPRGLRPKLDRSQTLDLDIVHHTNLDLIAKGEGTAELLWDFAGGVLTWSLVAHRLQRRRDEMGLQLALAFRLVNRYGRTGRVIFDGPDYQVAKAGVGTMQALAEVVDQPTAAAAADWAETIVHDLQQRPLEELARLQPEPINISIDAQRRALHELAMHNGQSIWIRLRAPDPKAPAIDGSTEAFERDHPGASAEDLFAAEHGEDPGDELDDDGSGHADIEDDEDASPDLEDRLDNALRAADAEASGRASKAALDACEGSPFPRSETETPEREVAAGAEETKPRRGRKAAASVE